MREISMTLMQGPKMMKDKDAARPENPNSQLKCPCYSWDHEKDHYCGSSFLRTIFISAK
jgi:hypothetical protein